MITENHVELVQEWITTTPQSVAKQFLIDHDDRLLAPTSDVVLDEIALRLPDRSAIELYRELLNEARRTGIDKAYRPHLALEDLQNWLGASLNEKRSMLKEQQIRTRLLGPDVAATLRALRGARPDDTDLVAAEALMILAHAGRDDAAFEAMAHPQGFPACLPTFPVLMHPL